MATPRPVIAVASCVAASLLGDGSLYVVLPVVFTSRGLEAWQVGIILSANRWIRLLTNAPAARVLGTRPIRMSFAGALLVAGCTSLAYVTTSFSLLVLARLVWGACWSIIRLSGLLIVTDCVDANLVSESSIGKMTGLFAGLSRVGSAVGMAAGGFICDHFGFEALFFLAGVLTIAVAPFAFACAFGSLPAVSVTAASRLEQLEQHEQHEQATEQASASSGHRRCCRAPRWSAVQVRLFALAFSASCAGNGLIVSTLGAVLAGHSEVDASSGKSYLDLGFAHVDTATFNGAFIGGRWALEGLIAPLFGRVIDRHGWRTIAPASFALSSANGCLGFVALWSAESAGRDASGGLLLLVLVSLVLFFLLVSAADLSVKAMGVMLREAPLLVQGDDLGAAVGPLLGYALLQTGLNPSAVLATQALVHGAAALVACSAARAEPHSGGRIVPAGRASSRATRADVALQSVALTSDSVRVVRED